MIRLAVLLALVVVLSAAGIDLGNLFDYAGQAVPNYIQRDNTPSDNPINNLQATVGRVLFYDQALSLNNTVSCATCHQQAMAFGDSARQSIGFDGGLTSRHSMRLVNVRFSENARMFWNQRANNLEEQATQPIQDHGEMGFSGTLGQPGIDSLLRRMASLPRYQRLWPEAFGTDIITEEHLQRAIAQFVRSIQSFDSRFDEGLAQVGAVTDDFPNFTNQENLGKSLFLRTPRGANCASCHRPPEFDIEPFSHNNGITTNLLNPTEQDLTNTRTPTLRDLAAPDGTPNGPFMHDGSLPTLLSVIEHYDDIEANIGIDRRLVDSEGNGQELNLSDQQKNALVAFLRTLTGQRMYTEEAYADPFEADGSLVIDEVSSIAEVTDNLRLSLSPNPIRFGESLTSAQLNVPLGVYQVHIVTLSGKHVTSFQAAGPRIALPDLVLTPGTYLVRAEDSQTGRWGATQLLVQ